MASWRSPSALGRCCASPEGPAAQCRRVVLEAVAEVADRRQVARNACRGWSSPTPSRGDLPAELHALSDQKLVEPIPASLRSRGVANGTHPAMAPSDLR